MWIRHNRQGGEWADQPAWLEALRQSGHFGATVEASHNAAFIDASGAENARTVRG